ncbi:phage tail tape-measure protein, partial [Paenibacillus sp. AR247]
MMTSPVGIAVGAVGLVTAAVISYKNHQKEAREELLNMGDTLQKSFDDYGALDYQTKRTQNLIREYDRLTEKIKDSKTPAEELTEARRKLVDVEKELIKLNPDIISAEDAKTGMLRDQAEAADRINQAKQQIAKRDLEASVMDKEEQLPELVKEYKELQDSVEGYQQAYEDASKSRAQYYSYINERDKILNSTQMGSQEQSDQLSALAEKISQQTGIWNFKMADLDYGLAKFTDAY